MSFFEQLVVLELASVLAGPAVGAFFAELGATVIKLEPLSGDVTRHWRLPSEPPQGINAYYSCVNWGKQSLSMNLKHPRAQALAQQLATQADIVIANYKPGAAEALGVDADTLRAHNPALIYAHLTGYGSEDPRSGYDALIQAESGFLYLNGHPNQPPVKMPVALMDLLAAHQLKEALLVALLNRSGHGQGDTITLSLMDSALASLANQASNWLVAGHSPQAMGLEHPNIVPYGTLYRCADEIEIMLAIGSDHQFEKLCALLAHPELSQDPRFQRNQDRVVHRQLLHRLLAQEISKYESSDLLSQCHAAGLPAGQVRDIPSALATSAAQALMLQSPEGQLRGLRSCVFKSQKQPWQELVQPPLLGQESSAILKRYCGISDTELTQLLQEKIIGMPEPGQTSQKAP